MSAEEVAKAFIQHFYQGFDANVESLASLFVSTVVVSVVACLSVCLPACLRRQRSCCSLDSFSLSHVVEASTLLKTCGT